jgi:hypothetical protein
MQRAAPFHHQGDKEFVPVAACPGAEDAGSSVKATSTRSRRVVAPPGSGHNFVYEDAQWTIGVMREVILGTVAPASDPQS